MIEIKLEFPYIKLETRDFGFLSAVKEHFSGFAPGYRFSPKYEAGVWDGKIYMLRDRKLPYGLLTDLLKLYKKDFSHVQLVLDPALSRVFNTPVKEATDLTSLKWPAAEHQIECIAAALPYGKGIIRAATGAGKSLIMAYIAKNYFDAKYIKKLLIVVPSKSLIAQLESDFVDYGINENLIGKVFSGAKEWDKKIVISTWQSLANNHDKLPAFDAIFIDETHSAKAVELKTILEQACNSHVRIGFTGTLPDELVDLWTIKGFLGPILKEISVDYLKNKGWLADCTINIINIHYKEDLKKEIDYHEAKDILFKKGVRLRTIRQLVANVKEGSVLLLVGKVETEGQFLQDYLEQYFSDRKIVFVSGKMSIEDREYWRMQCRDPKNKIILIATYPVFQAGVDIPALGNIIFAAPFKSKIRILQSIGRALRKHITKTNGAQIYDLVDHNNKWFSSASNIRKKYYNKENFKTIDFEIQE